MLTVKRSKQWLAELLLSSKHFWTLAAIILVGDAILTQFIIHYVPYTEIDFETYMRQVDVYEKGERNYSLITGPSGPLVYPAGHVLIHRLLSVLTKNGSNLNLAQQVYGLLYLCSILSTCAIYHQAKGVPNYILLLLPLSKRLHSLFVLRLFNDCWALVAVQAALLAYACGWDDVGSVLYSSALSIKMSILLYLPGLLVLLFKRHGLIHTVRHVSTMVLLQLLVALPFLRTHPSPYFASAFEFSRVFLYKWTVNWRFLPEEVFLSRTWAQGLLAVHLIALIAFASTKWFLGDGGVWNVLAEGLRHPHIGPAKSKMTADHVITILFTSNLIGVCFARSLHYQFYTWYAQQVPFLLCRTKYPMALRLAILVCVEYAWNVFPSTELSSGVLVTCNLLLIVGIWFGYPEGLTYKPGKLEKRNS